MNVVLWLNPLRPGNHIKHYGNGLPDTEICYTSSAIYDPGNPDGLKHGADKVVYVGPPDNLAYGFKPGLD